MLLRLTVVQNDVLRQQLRQLRRVLLADGLVKGLAGVQQLLLMSCRGHAGGCGQRSDVA